MERCVAVCAIDCRCALCDIDGDLSPKARRERGRLRRARPSAVVVVEETSEIVDAH